MNQHTPTQTKGVVVYCASSSEIDSIYLATARRMGEPLPPQGFRLSAEVAPEA